MTSCSNNLTTRVRIRKDRPSNGSHVSRTEAPVLRTGAKAFEFSCKITGENRQELLARGPNWTKVLDQDGGQQGWPIRLRG
jgi:hypothetical protein